MSNVERLAQLVAEMERLAIEEQRLRSVWEAAIAAADDASLQENSSGLLAAVAAAEQVGPDLLAVLNKIEEIESVADDVQAAAIEEFENSLTPLRDKITAIYLEIPSPDEDWSSYLDAYREEAAQILDAQGYVSEGRKSGGLGYFLVR